MEIIILMLAACSHEKGSYYGGTECIPKEIYVCSICGDNYWGGDCPHSEGAWYDEGYCELDKITICNICGNNSVSYTHLRAHET